MSEVRLPAPVAATLVPDVDDRADLPGAFGYYVHAATGDSVMRGLIYVCPCGCGVLHALPFHPLTADDKRHGRAGWRFDGHRERPTLSPSILSHEGGTKDGPTHWHGYLRKGFWTQA